MKTRIRNRWLGMLLAVIMAVGMMPLSSITVSAESGSENPVGASRAETRVASSSAYPALTNLVEGTEITYGYVYFFYKNGKVDQR